MIFYPIWFVTVQNYLSHLAFCQIDKIVSTQPSSKPFNYVDLN